MTGYIWDIILIVIVTFFIIKATKKGFIGASKTIVSLLLTAILFASFQPTVLDFLQKSTLGDNIKTMVSKNITKTYEKEQLPEDADTTDTEQSLMICEALSLPAFLSASIEENLKQMSQIKNNVMEVITDSITLLILRLLSLLLLFVAVKIFVLIALKILESLFELPGLKTINRSLGALLGVFNALLAVYIICGLITLLIPTDKLSTIKTVIDSTYIVKYFYDNNLLLSLFV